ncbi:MAG TPA: mismatch-specific DNA-glycosylase [Vicinamibacterales bacterium]|jgi:double-stranded uracil-DNA glycosylase|nr:mismatch-specific DNA-glycosylase [Vicinamibacterales bacterium]
MTRIIEKVLPPLRDRIRAGVEVLFVGINPGVRSALTGHHFAGFSNRFWKVLYEAGLVPEPITFEDDDRLPDWGFGITNIVARATPGIDTLRPHEYVAGRKRLLQKVRRFRPRVVALVGVTVFRAMFPEHKGAVELGVQEQTLGDSVVFVLPNTSGRNANFSYGEMVDAFKGLRKITRSVRLHPDRFNESGARRSTSRPSRQSAGAARRSRSQAR